MRWRCPDRTVRRSDRKSEREVPMQQGSVPPLGSVGPILAIPLGLLSCFFGYKLLKAIMGLAGFGVGCAAGVMLLGSLLLGCLGLVVQMGRGKSRHQRE
jgi:hypothetical protein